MSTKMLVSRSSLTAIGASIRSKNHEDTKYLPSEMAAAIDAIEDPSVLTTKAITVNGSYDAADDEADGYSVVTVNVPNSYEAADEGKVVSAGALVAQTSTTVTQNGTVDTTLNDEVVVNVPSQAPTLVSKTITQNGIYDPEDDSADGYSEVTVNVPSSARIKQLINDDYYCDETGAVICTLDGRVYKKYNSDPAFVAYAYDGGYTGPLLVSETNMGACFSVGDTPFNPRGTEVIDGKTYYVSSTENFMFGNLTSTAGVALKLSDSAVPEAEQASMLVEKAHNGGKFSANGRYPVPSGYEGWGDIVVDVPANVGTKSITQNGTYRASSDGYNGYSIVSVNVSDGGGEDPFALTDYIESSGTQFINTGYSVKDNTSFELLANPSTTQQMYATMFGTRASNDDSPTSYSCLLATAWASNLGNANWGSNINRLTSADKGNKSLYRMFKNRCIVCTGNTIDDVICSAQIDSTQSATTSSLFLFTLGVNGSDYGSVTHCSMKLYRFRVYEGDTLMMELLPHEDNGEACLKDTVTGNLFKNAGTGAFTYGTDE